MARRFPRRPVVGVGALVVEGQRVMLVKRRFEPGRGFWAVPGGAVELGERLTDAVKREVWEETGLTIEPLKILGVFDIIRPDANGRVRFHFVIVDYLARRLKGEPRPNREVMDARWIRLRELSGMRLTPTTRELLRRQGLLRPPRARPASVRRHPFHLMID